MVEKVLDEFEIKKEQVIYIITDNASNMLSMVEKLNAVTEEENDCEVEPFNDDIDPDDGHLDNAAENSVMLSHIEHMRFTVHTLQLSIRDGLKEQHIQTC